MMSLLEASTTVEGQFERIRRRHVAAQTATLLLGVRKDGIPCHREVMLLTMVGMQLLSTVFSTITSQASRDLPLITYSVSRSVQWIQHCRRISARSTLETAREPRARIAS